MTAQKPTILFDFDGTLAETMALIHRVYNRLSPVYGYQALAEDEIEEHRHLSVREFLAKVGIPLWKLPVIAIHARWLMHQDIHEVHPPAGLAEVLCRIHESGRYNMGILTSNHRRNVLKFLSRHAMGWFDDVQATHAILCKKRRVLKYIRQNQLNPENLYYIGDTSIDVESARRAGVKSVAVAWGLNSANMLSQSNPDHLVERPEELLDIFQTA